MVRLVTLKILVSYIIVVLIALQSVFSIFDTTTTHQYSHEQLHQESDHHSAIGLSDLLIQPDDDENNHSNNGEKHPDCHQSHCHHGSIVFVELDIKQSFDKQDVSQLTLMESFFISYFISPDLRPPIV